MKRILYILTAIVLCLASCARQMDIAEISASEEVSLDMSIRFQTKAGSPQPVVSSIRIAAFDSNGQCAYNSVMTSGFTLTEESYGYSIGFDNPFTLGVSTSAVFTVYAILNEAGYILENTERTLTSLLDECTVGTRTIGKFSSYFTAKVKYTATPVSGPEPAFLMGSSASVKVPEGSSSVPYHVEFDMMKRSMAQVTVGSISAPSASVNLSKIIITDVSLVRIPAGSAWSSTAGHPESNNVTVKIGDISANGAYQRTADAMSVSVTYDNIKKIRSTGDTLYVSQKDRKETTFDPYTEKNGERIINTNFYFNDSATADAPGNFGDNSFAKNIGLVVGVIETRLSSITPTPSYHTNPAAISPSAWEIELNESLYVPESITDDSEDAMCIRVRAAVAEPGFATDDIIGAVPGWNPYTYYSGANAFPTAVANKAEANAFLNLIALPKQVYTGENKGVPQYKYMSYVPGIRSEQTATASVTLDSSTSDIVWAPIDTKTFYIPVNNAVFDGDYSVRRNTKYTVNLQVSQSTYDAITTRAGVENGACSDFVIDATVTAEKMEDYE